MSKIEERFKKISSAFRDYPVDNLVDAQGVPFNAKTDSIPIELTAPYRGFSRIVVELKEHPLNSLKNQETCLKKLRSICNNPDNKVPWSEDDSHYDIARRLYRLNNSGHLQGWNQSRAKQQAVSQRVAEEDTLLIIVFSKHPVTLGTGRSERPWRDYYQQKHGLHALSESDFKRVFIESGLALLPPPRKALQPIRKASRKAATRCIFRKAA